MMDNRDQVVQHNDEGTVTRLLREVQDGDVGANERLFQRIYEELRLIASSRISGEGRTPADGEATDLIHEAYARLAGQQFNDRKHLFMTYARVMRNILVDRARRNNARKRGGGRARVPLEPSGAQAPVADHHTDLIENAELFQLLRARQPDAADVFELRFFGGLAYRDIAAILGRSEHQVRSLWNESLAQIRRWSDETA